MKLMTKEIERKLPKLYSTEGVKLADKQIIVKYFSCWMPMTWYAVEYDAESRLFFGYVQNHIESHYSEWGYFSLDEFEEINREKGYAVIERDYHFKPATFDEIV